MICANGVGLDGFGYRKCCCGRDCRRFSGRGERGLVSSSGSGGGLVSDDSNTGSLSERLCRRQNRHFSASRLDSAHGVGRQGRRRFDGAFFYYLRRKHRDV